MEGQEPLRTWRIKFNLTNRWKEFMSYNTCQVNQNCVKRLCNKKCNKMQQEIFANHVNFLALTMTMV